MYEIDKCLHQAVLTGNLDDIIGLLILNADIDAADSLGTTPLHVACFWDSFEVAKFLIDAGAKVNTRGRYGKTPLHAACYHCSVR